jgi:hypothetical protein
LGGDEQNMPKRCQMRCLGHRCVFFKIFFVLTNVLLCVEVVNYGKHDGEEDGGRQGDENEPERHQTRRSSHR